MIPNIVTPLEPTAPHNKTSRQPQPSLEPKAIISAIPQAPTDWQFVVNGKSGRGQGSQDPVREHGIAKSIVLRRPARRWQNRTDVTAATTPTPIRLCVTACRKVECIDALFL